LINAEERVVIHHDHRLNPDLTRDKRGLWINTPTPLIKDLDTVELKSYDIGQAKPDSKTHQTFPRQYPSDGESILLLSDLAEWWKNLKSGRPIINIELKSHPECPDHTPPAKDYVGIVIDEIKRLDLMEHVWIQAFDWSLLIETKRQCKSIPTGFLSAECDDDPTVWKGKSSPWLAGFDPFCHNGTVADAVVAAGGDYWGPWYGDLCQKSVAHARNLGLGVHPWTLNESADIKKTLEWGVTGITTDYPDLARKIFHANRIAVPDTLDC
jgi:glycerophosphoryl diester phosphodiesterase